MVRNFRIEYSGGFTMKRLVWTLAVLFAIARPAAAQEHEHDTGGAPRVADPKSIKAMGFDQDKAVHHFKLFDDGGSIEVSVKDPGDQKNITAIRVHLNQASDRFGDGDFSMPMTVHANTKIPGTADLKRLSSKIIYAYIPTDTGGKVNIMTRDPAALKALHEFLQFQITDHETGDSTEISQR